MDLSKKSEKLKYMSSTLEAFDAKYKDMFLCPTCMETTHLQNSKHITRAHILPRAARGNLTTWLCSKCNSKFGQGGDRWLGEYLHYLQTHSLLDTGVSKGKIEIEGMPLHGSVQRTTEGIDILISLNRNSPERINRMNEEFSRLKTRRTVSIGIPLLSKERELNLGFVTAAYLYGFSLFGYSWVLQHHFAALRKYILMKENITALPVHISKVQNDPDPSPIWFGIAEIDHDYIPCVRIMKTIVCFPPFYAPNKLELVRKPQGTFQVQMHKVNGIPPYNYTGPYTLVVGEKVIIYPDAGLVNSMIGFVVYIDPADFHATILDQFINPNHVSPEAVDKRVHIKIEPRESEGD